VQIFQRATQHGVKKGDIVTIYLPRIPEQIIAMLACAKIGAPHSVVYGGFSVEALPSESKMLRASADHLRWRLAAR
jgi:acyl-coenzyme A synthetase/AMP-(fatty) acid ligase